MKSRKGKGKEIRNGKKKKSWENSVGPNSGRQVQLASSSAWPSNSTFTRASPPPFTDGPVGPTRQRSYRPLPLPLRSLECGPNRPDRSPQQNPTTMAERTPGSRCCYAYLAWSPSPQAIQANGAHPCASPTTDANQSAIAETVRYHRGVRRRESVSAHRRPLSSSRLRFVRSLGVRARRDFSGRRRRRLDESASGTSVNPSRCGQGTCAPISPSSLHAV
jgi:hypothetical protein